MSCPELGEDELRWTRAYGGRPSGLDADSCPGCALPGPRGSREVLSPRSAAASGWSTRYTGSGVRYAAGPACSEQLSRPVDGSRTDPAVIRVYVDVACGCRKPCHRM